MLRCTQTVTLLLVLTCAACGWYAVGHRVWDLNQPEGSWLDDKNGVIANASAGGQFLFGLYFCYTTIFSASYGNDLFYNACLRVCPERYFMVHAGDITPHAWQEIIVCIVMIFIGEFFLAGAFAVTLIVCRDNSTKLCSLLPLPCKCPDLVLQRSGVPYGTTYRTRSVPCAAIMVPRWII